MASVLLAEDNPDTVDFLSRRLSEAGFDVLVARNGADAFALALREKPDAIVIDVNLPRVAGDEVIRRLRAEAALGVTPVIFVTADYTTRVAQSLVPGQVLCMEKAIRARALIENLQGLLASQGRGGARPG